MALYAQPGPQARVPCAYAWPLPGGHARMPKAVQRYQLKQQTCPDPQLPRCHSQSSRPLTSLAATAKPAANVEAFTAELSGAGIPDKVIANTLKKYPPYLGWPIHTKLRPALQLWLKDLSSQQLSERLDKYPKLLVRTPQECTDVYLWLASLGVDAERIQQKLPMVMGRKLNEVQSTFQTIQTALELTNEQLPAFFKQHYFGLWYSSVRVSQTLQTIAELLAVPVAAKEMHEVMKATGHELFDQVPAVLHDRVSFFCKEFEGGQHAAKAALKQGVYRVSADLLRERAAELRTMLGWTEEECNRALSSNPRILTYQPSTVATNIQKLQAHNFTALLFTSLPNTLAPRWCFLMRLEAAQADFKAADHLTALATLSDQLFAETFNMLEEGLKYDYNF